MKQGLELWLMCTALEQLEAHIIAVSVNEAFTG
jgi:hypothetical protein